MKQSLTACLLAALLTLAAAVQSFFRVASPAQQPVEAIHAVASDAATTVDTMPADQPVAQQDVTPPPALLNETDDSFQSPEESKESFQTATAQSSRYTRPAGRYVWQSYGFRGRRGSWVWVPYQPARTYQPSIRTQPAAFYGNCAGGRCR